MWIECASISGLCPWLTPSTLSTVACMRVQHRVCVLHATHCNATEPGVEQLCRSPRAAVRSHAHVMLKLLTRGAHGQQLQRNRMLAHHACDAQHRMQHS
jgi:hypothetical protein